MNDRIPAEMIPINPKSLFVLTLIDGGIPFEVALAYYNTYNAALIEHEYITVHEDDVRELTVEDVIDQLLAQTAQKVKARNDMIVRQRAANVNRNPCNVCHRRNRCEMGGRECRRFSDWFGANWQRITTDLYAAATSTRAKFKITIRYR